MKKEKQPTPIVNVGTSSLLIIFVILSLVVFAALSLSGAKSDYDFSKNLADRKTAYYSACNQAEQIAADIDQILAEGGDLADYRDADLKIEGNTVSYMIPISDSQAVDVVLDIEGSYYKVSKWQVVSTKEWEEDNSLNLMNIE